MFGHQDNDSSSSVTVAAAEPEASSAPVVSDTITPADDVPVTITPSAPPTEPTDMPLETPAPEAAIDEPTPASAPTIDDSAASDYIMTDAPHADGDSTPAVQGAAATDDLLGLKQQALQQLSPLVDQLEQTPEEKFRTTMMMIQASDDQSLIKTAYEAAKLIADEKTRAQALLDVVNEINYFTQHQTSGQ